MIPDQKNLDEMSHAILLKVIEKVHTLTGITVTEQKKTMLQMRLKKRMKHLSITTYEAYIAFLEKNKDEVQMFINAVTTNETSFFRTPRVWDYFQQEFLPSWFAANPNGTLRLWSAAASSGEEAYGLAICCQEFQKRNPKFQYRITATDISTEVLKEAEEGVYSGRSMEFLRKSKAQIFDLYFTVGPDETFLIKKELKAKIQFTTHNLFTVRKEMFDIIFLRNVLIYFSNEDQEKVLNTAAKSLDKNGILVIGESESLNRLQTPYEYKVACIYSLKGAGPP